MANSNKAIAKGVFKPTPKSQDVASRGSVKDVGKLPKGGVSTR